jgi:type IV secretory pathway TrbD component
MLLLRAPAFAVKWMLAVFGVLVWIVVAPIKEILGEVVARLRGVRKR